MRHYYTLFLIFVLFAIPAITWAEGSATLFPSSGVSGYRAELTSTTVSPDNYCGIINTGKHFVYAKSGETIYIGSSAMGYGGNIKVTDPSGIVASYSGSSAGAIANRTQELAGPKALKSNGYNAISITVTSANQGIWTVEFNSSSPTANLGISTYAAHNLNSTYSWSANYDQPNPWPCIVAWDITVANGSTAIPGRVYMNVFTGNLGGASQGFNGSFYVLTPDGFQYLINNNGLAPYVFAFFSNNRGLEDNTTGLAVFKSAANATIANYPSHTSTTYKFKDPTAADDAVNVTNKIFYNTPATDMPATSSIYQGGASATTWLYTSTPTAAQVSNLSITGKEGQTFFSTGNLAGGYINFTTTSACRYKINIDTNNNGSYSDAVDVTLTGEATAGNNSVAWDGNNGSGTAVPSGSTISAKVTVYSGEVHFPLSDAENNPNGTILKRLSDSDYTIYWNDVSLAGAGTDLSSTGTSSVTGAHKWSTSANSGTATTNNTTTDFGNQNIIDTWAYTTTTTVSTTATVVVKQATDLYTSSIAKNVSSACAGSATNVTYTVVVGNNGPGDASGAQFIFEVPSGVTINSVSSSVTKGTGSSAYLSKGLNSYNNNEWRETVSLTNGGTITYTIGATIGTGVAAGTLVARASMLRASNITDPDATNSDNGTPSDPVAECAAVNAAITCNNIKTDDFTLNPPPTISLTSGSSSQTVCAGTAITSTIYTFGGGATNATVTNLPAGLISTVSTTANTVTISGTPTASGIYTITTSGGSCGITTTTGTVTVNALPTVSNTTGGSVCGSGKVTLGATASAGAINWYSASIGGSSLNSGTSYTTPSLSSTTTYYVDATANGCTTTSRTGVTATVNGLPTITITGSGVACANSTGNIYSTESGMSNYAWTVIGGTITSGGTTSSNTATVTWGSAGTGTISVNYSNGNGCAAAVSTSKSVAINALPTITITGSDKVCANTTGNIYSTESGMSNYVWNVSGGTITSGGTSTSNTVTVTWGSAGTGTISVNYSNGNGCTAAVLTSKSVTINALPIATISGTTSVCQNSSSPSITFKGSNGTAPYTFNYLVSDGTNTTSTTVTSNSGGVATVSASTTTVGTFTYMLTSVKDASSTTCSNTASGSATITVNPLPTASISGTTTVCQNATAPAITFTGNGGTAPYTFTYTVNGGSNQTVTTTSGNNVTVPQPTGTAGTFTYALVSVKDASSTTCSNTASGSAIITINALPSTFSVTGGGSYCASGSGVPVGLSNSQSGINYQLQLNGSNSGASVTGTGSAISFGNQISAGTYIVMATNTTTGCSVGMTGSAIVSINPLPTTPAVSNSILSNTCPSSTVNIAGLITSSTPSGCSLLYKTTNDPAGIDVTDPTKVGTGTYYIFYKNASGCSSYPATPVTVTIHSCNDLSITKAVSDMNPLVGTDVTFTITAYNGSTDMVTATEVKVADKLLPNYAFKSYTVTTGTYDNASGIWTIGSLSPKSSAVLTITATVQ